jgi:hypothetical protein
MTSREKIIAVIAGVFALLLMWALVRGHDASVDAAKQAGIAALATQKAAQFEAQKVSADKDRDIAKSDADGYKSDAENFLALSHAKDATIATLKAKIAAMGAQKPVTNPSSLPTDAQSLAADFTTEGFPPSEIGATMGWPLTMAPSMLGLIQDGKQYPEALTRIDALGQEVTLHEQKEADLTTAVTDQTKRGDSLDTALASSKVAESDCEQAGAQKDIVIAADKAQIKDAKKQRITWGAIGAAAGTAFGVLLHLLL